MTAASTIAVRHRADLAGRYLELVGAGDEAGAVTLVTRLLQHGMSAELIMLDVIGAAEAQVGQLWADNHWSVAREHAATAIGDRAVAAVAARVDVQPSRGRITVACVDGEWHALPVRILTEILRLRGWRTDFLGANVPGPHLVTHLHQTDADTVALSCMLPTRLPRAHAAITACQAAGVPVIAGGRGFGADGRYARLFGANAWAGRADTAADRLAGDDWPPPAAHPPPPQHFADEEYTRLVRRRPILVDAALHRLAEVHPPAAVYEGWQRDSTVDDFGNIIDFLAAALYVDDAAVFTDFVVWTSRVLAARGVPAAAVATGLDIYREVLADYPRAGAMLTRGVREVRTGAA